MPLFSKYSHRRNEAIAGYLFVLPVILGFLIWVLGPMIATALISFTRWPVIRKPTWLGLSNYVTLFTTDPFFYDSLKATLYFGTASVAVRIVYAFLIALLLNQDIKGRSVFRTVYYLPSIVPIVASSMIWLWCFQPDFGLFNSVLKSVGLPTSRWVHGPNSVIPSFVLMDLWTAGNTIIIFLAGLQGVPRSLLDAVAIDGGTWHHRMRAVTIPHMTPFIFFNAVIGLVNAFQTFTQSFVMTEGGPNKRSLFMVLLVYREGFQNLKMGLASAIAIVLFVIIAGLTAVIFRTSRSWVFYYGDER